jgi:hypothetical protein
MSEAAALVLTLQLRKFGLLVSCEYLKELGIGFGVRRCHLCGQTADSVRGLIDGRAIALGYRRLDRLVRGFHLIVQWLQPIHGVGENRSCLLLLRGRESELRSQEIDSVLDHGRGIGWLWVLRQRGH